MPLSAPCRRGLRWHATRPQLRSRSWTQTNQVGPDPGDIGLQAGVGFEESWLVPGFAGLGKEWTLKQKIKKKTRDSLWS